MGRTAYRVASLVGWRKSPIVAVGPLVALEKLAEVLRAEGIEARPVALGV